MSYMTFNFLLIGARPHTCLQVYINKVRTLHIIHVRHSHDNNMFCYFFLIQRYKERLQTKYIKSLKPEDTSKSLVGKNWIFLKDGLDDFRDGLPPPVKGEVLIKVCYTTYIAHKCSSMTTFDVEKMELLYLLFFIT